MRKVHLCNREFDDGKATSRGVRVDWPRRKNDAVWEALDGVLTWKASRAALFLSTFRVNTLLDTDAVNLRTGKDASGHVSLRSAIEAANSRPSADTIMLPSGMIRLTIAGANEDRAATGDLDMNRQLEHQGEGRRIERYQR